MPTRERVAYFELGDEVCYHTGNNRTTRVKSGRFVTIIEEGIVVQTGRDCRVLPASDLMPISDD